MAEEKNEKFFLTSEISVTTTMLQVGNCRMCGNIVFIMERWKGGPPPCIYFSCDCGAGKNAPTAPVDYVLYPPYFNTENDAMGAGANTEEK